MSRRRAVAVASAGVALLLFTQLAPLGFLGLPGSPFPTASGGRAPESTVDELPEFTRDQVVSIRYEARGGAGSSGVFWTELWYRIAEVSDWSLYAPPWNPDGRWYGALGFDAGALTEGVIPFDTFFAGGEREYEFTTVAVDRGFWREAGPDRVKASTTLDTRPPQLFIASPTPDAWTNGKRLGWSATDEVSGLVSVAAALDGGPTQDFEVASGAKQASGGGDLAITAEGDYGVTIRASDRAGNLAEVYIPFHFDPNAPTLAITSPEHGSFVGSRDVAVEWTAGDSGAGISAVRIAIDGAGPLELAGDVTAHVFEGLAESSHVVVLTAIDAAGNVAVQALPFGVDVSAPEVALVSPRPDSYANGQDLLVLWTGHDNVSGIDHFELALVEVARSSPDLPSAAGFTFSAVSEREHTVRLVAVDRAGNEREVSVKVTVDRTAPSVAITSPARGSTVYGNVQVNWTATDGLSDIQRVELVFDSGTPLLTTGATTHRVSPNPAEGAHYVLVRAWDKAGNMAEAGVPFTYGGAGPPQVGPLGLPAFEFWLIMVLIGAIAVTSAYIAVRRRKRAQA